MAVLKGLDASRELTRFAGSLRHLGYDFVMRYYSHNSGKNLSLGEAQALSRAGMQIGVVWETLGDHAGFFSRAQGVADGGAAFQMAHETIGQPFDSTIYFAVDYDATDADLAGPVTAYFEGVRVAFHAVSGEVPHYDIGVYGSGLCCTTLLAAGLAKHSWLSQSTDFSGSRAYARDVKYNLIQRLPVSVDVGDGVLLRLDPDSSSPDKKTGLFSI